MIHDQTQNQEAETPKRVIISDPSSTMDTGPKKNKSE